MLLAIPTSKARFRHFFHHDFNEQPLGMAGVIPIILAFFSASSMMVWPNTSWYFGGCGLSDFVFIFRRLSYQTNRVHAIWSDPFPPAYILSFYRFNNAAISGPGYPSGRAVFQPASSHHGHRSDRNNGIQCFKKIAAACLAFLSILLQALLPCLRVNVLPTGSLPSSFQTSSCTSL